MVRIVALVLVLWVTTRAQVRLSEVMFRPDTLANYTEFIEIVNLGNQPVDLNGWALGDSLDVDALVAPQGTWILPPGHFAVILDAGYFDHATIYDALIPDTALVLTIEDASFGRYGLRNDPPLTIFLYNANGQLVDSVRYTSDNPPGFSDEKIDLAGPNTPQNWANSRQFRGTPGAPNSVTPRPTDGGLLNLFWSDSLLWDDTPVDVAFQVANGGTRMISQLTLILLVNQKTRFTADVATSLAPGDTGVMVLPEVLLPDGWVLLEGSIQIPGDEDTTNNSWHQWVYVETAAARLVLNEIMFDPRSGEGEWVEITNTGTQPVTLQQVRFTDFRDTVVVPVESLIVVPGELWVLAEDSSVVHYPSVNPDYVVVLPRFPTLNNDVDEISLISPGGRLYDRVRYTDAWYGRKTDRGTSLEKINPHLPGQQASSWAAAVAREGATPTQENSVFVTETPVTSRFTIAPNPFSPDGDGQDDFTLISLELSSTIAYLSCRIFDVRGRLVRTLALNQPTGSRVRLVWDGRTDTGQIAAIGMYVVLVEAYLTTSNKKQQFKGVVVLAKQK